MRQASRLRRAFPSTCEEYTIDTIPSGRQQNSVVRIAQTRWFGMYSLDMFIGSPFMAMSFSARADPVHILANYAAA